jgi:hypothetical protein
MVDTSELSAESQVEFAKLTASVTEFFGVIDRLTRGMDDLSRLVAALDARLAIVEKSLV